MQRLKAFVLSRGETYTPENVNLSPHQETPSDTKAVFKQCPQLADSMLALALVFRRLYVPGLPGHRSDVVIWDFVVYIRVVMLRRARLVAAANSCCCQNYWFHFVYACLISRNTFAFHHVCLLLFSAELVPPPHLSYIYAATLHLACEESRLKLNNSPSASRTKADGVVPLQSLTTLFQALSLLSPAARKCSRTHSLKHLKPLESSFCLKLRLLRN